MGKGSLYDPKSKVAADYSMTDDVGIYVANMQPVLSSTPEVAEVHTYDNIVTIAIAVLCSIGKGRRQLFAGGETCSKEEHEIYYTKILRKQIRID